MNVEIEIEYWPEGAWQECAMRAAEATSAIEPAIAHPRLETSVLFTSDEQVHQLNREWRERDTPTNVLSFPMLERENLLTLDPAEEPDQPPAFLGDIALAFETCSREAEAKGITLEQHVTHLLVHGLLHLAGHDHVDSDAQAEEMEALEVAALAKLGIADPYGDR